MPADLPVPYVACWRTGRRILRCRLRAQTLCRQSIQPSCHAMLPALLPARLQRMIKNLTTGDTPFERVGMGA